MVACLGNEQGRLVVESSLDFCIVWWYRILAVRYYMNKYQNLSDPNR